jgi:hypothetical protein
MFILFLLAQNQWIILMNMPVVYSTRHQQYSFLRNFEAQIFEFHRGTLMCVVFSVQYYFIHKIVLWKLKNDYASSNYVQSRKIILLYY